MKSSHKKMMLAALLFTGFVVQDVRAQSREEFDAYAKQQRQKFVQYMTNRQTEFNRYREQCNREFAEYLKKAWNRNT